MATYITLDNLAEFLNQLVEKKFDPMQADINEKLDSDENAVSASKLYTARTIALEGDATGSVSFDGSSNVTITVTVTNGSHTHTISNVSDLGSGWATALASALSATIAELNYLSGVTSNVQTQLDGKLGTEDNAVSATKLATARTITLAGDVTGSVSFDGSGNVTINTTLASSGSATLSRTKEIFTTTTAGIQTYTLTDYTTSKLLDVYLNGFKLNDNEYTVSGTTFTTVNEIEADQVFEFVITEIA